MTKKEFVDDIKNMIANGHIESAIELMKNYGKNFENELTIHSFRYNDLQKSDRTGVISREKANEEKARICWSLLEIVDKIDMEISPNFNFRISAELEDVLALAEFQSRKDGQPKTSTRYFFAALKKLKPQSLYEILLDIESQNGLPDLVTDEISEMPRSFSKSRTLSPCLIDSFSNLDKIASDRSPIEVEDMFIDVAKYGTGTSVKLMREMGIDEKVINILVEKYKMEIKKRT